MSLTEFMEKRQAAMQHGLTEGLIQTTTKKEVNVNDLYSQLSDARIRLNATNTTISREGQIPSREYKLALQDKTDIEAEIASLERQIAEIEAKKNPAAADEYWK